MIILFSTENMTVQYQFCMTKKIIAQDIQAFTGFLGRHAQYIAYILTFVICIYSCTYDFTK